MVVCHVFCPSGMSRSQQFSSFVGVTVRRPVQEHGDGEHKGGAVQWRRAAAALLPRHPAGTAVFRMLEASAAAGAP